jgi:hypothetical protein
MAQFQQALSKLIEDQDYRQAVIEDWHRLTDDYGELEPHEMLLLLQVWNATDQPGAANFIPEILLCHCCCSIR